MRRLDGRLDALAVVLVLRERLHHAAATHTHTRTHTHRHNSRHLTYGHLSVDSCYPRDAMLARVLAMALRPCLCLCPSVTSRYSIETDRRNNPGTAS